MAGSRRQYERAMKRAADHAEKKEWDKAVDQYQQALAEFPDDGAALIGIGQIFLNEAFLGDPDHKCMGRSAPARLERALAHARAHGLHLPVLEEIRRERVD